MDVVAGAGPQPLTLDAICGHIADALALPPDAVGADDDLLHLGLDSLSVMRLASRWRRLGVELAFADLLELRTPGEWFALASARGPARPEPAVAAVDPDEPFDLAPMQRAYWIGRADGQPLGGVGAHFYAEFDGTGVDAGRLATAVDRLRHRHPMLRAVIGADGRQRIARPGPPGRLPVLDLAGEPAGADLDARLARLRDDLSHRRLDVAAGEVFDVRLTLLPGGATRVHVHVEMLVADAHSFRVLMSDLGQLYRDPAAAAEPAGFGFAQYLATVAPARAERAEADRGYWLDRLDTLPADGPQLPLDRDPAQLAGHRVERHHHWMPGPVQAELAARATAHGLTLSTVFLTLFAEVLATWSTSPRFLLNLPLYDRQPVHPEVDALVGDFTGLLLLDVDASGSQPFARRAAGLQERLRENAAHSAFGGLDVLRELGRRQGSPASASVVFTSALNLGELFDRDVRAGFGDPVWTMSQTPQVSLDFQVTEREGGLYLNWDVVEGLFPAGLIGSMFAAYRARLSELTGSGPAWTGPPADLLPAATRAVRAGEAPPPPPARPRGLHDDFFARAQAAPDRPALFWGRAGRCSYGELAARADAVARRLLEAGLRPGDPVGVSLAGRAEQAVAVLGVLRAGGSYVPVGLEQPAARRNRIYRRAGTRLLLADIAVPGLMPGLDDLPAGSPLGPPAGVTVLPVEPVTGPAPRPPAGWAPPATDPEALAYLLFTSGSTGEPKGVMVTHAAALNTIDDLVARFGIGPDDRVLAVSALDFDLSVFDLFGLLGAGGAVVLATAEQRRDAQACAGLVRAWAVTIWQSVPALLDMLLVAAGSAGDGLPLRLALVGGDKVGLDLSARLAEVAPAARLIALGGTTETAIHSTVQEVPAELPAHWRSVPYGRPLGGQRMRVTDPEGRDRPDWVPGELWIGGASVARGYLGDPERTGRQFRTVDGCRWYRTGDLARYWPDGTVEFLGRIDRQVKIGGYRIEPGEIEAALRDDPDLAAAVVVTAGGAALRRLVAGVVGRDGVVVDPAAVRRRLGTRLPAHMVPEQVSVLARLPLSANGKVDRVAVARALAEGPPEGSPDGPAGSTAGSEPPRPGVEQAIAELWGELLGHERVGRQQSFFALGGDSLVATRLLARMRAAGLGGVSVPDLFRHPRLADFAAGAVERLAAPDRPVLVADPERAHEPFEPTDVQRAYWMGRTDDFELGGVGSHWYWEFDGEAVDLDRLEDAVNLLVERHDMLRAVFGPDGRQRVLASVDRFRIPVADGEPALAQLRDRLSARVPDPARWPLLEIAAVRYGGGGDRVRIGFSFDYIVLDALSIVIFFAELSALYREPRTVLPPLAITFRDYLLGVRPPAEALAAARRYWSGRAGELPPAPDLPMAKDPAGVVAPVFHRRAGTLPPERWAALVATARRHEVTPALVLATAYAEVLTRWGGGAASTINLTLFNRADVHPDADRILGDFTSLLLVDHRPAPGDDLLTRIRRLQATVWEGMAHGEVSAIWVLRELARRNGGSRAGMPVVFTSALGMPADLVDLDFPFGSLIWGISQTPQVWLDNQVMERAGGLDYNWDSVDELFPAGVLDAMFEAYGRLLETLADGEWTAEPPAALPAGQPAARAAANATAGPVRPRGLHEDFFARAAAEPDRPALLGNGFDPVPAGALARWALRVAAALGAAGVGPGDPVGVSLPRGPAQIAAVLGVLAAGGCYVPVGPATPAARRADVYDQAGVRVVIATGPEPGREWVAPEPAGEPLAAPVATDPGRLAYVIFTSGSTGRPKGVEVTHAAAVNTIDDVTERYRVGPADRVLAVSSLDFDLSVYDVFGLLGAGGAVVLVPDDDRREARTWLESVRRFDVTVWNSVPALLEMLLIAAEGSGPLPLRLALVSGDWVGLALPGRFHAAAGPGARFVALGGATEAAIWSNACEVGAVPAHWASIPYGRPLRNQQYRVVDPGGHDCPDWVAGELLIGGAGVAEGYRGDPGLTARRFFTDERGRWYRTGDRGRYWPDGTLEFLGRDDFQVKIRGHRIELGELEAAAAAHPGVEAALALVAGTGEARRLALLVTGSPPPEPAALTRTMALRLPDYMLPQQISVVDELPLSANGKVDRRAAAASLAPVAGGADDEPARPGLEADLARSWADLLGRADIGRGHSFFALGGDSLLATRLVTTLEQRFGVALTLRQLFAAPTVAELAEAIAAAAPGSINLEEGVI